MKRVVLVILLGIMVITPSSSPIFAQTPSGFLASEDCYADEATDYRSNNYNGYGLMVDYTNNFGSYRARWSTYVKFNLRSNLSGRVGPGTIVRFTILDPAAVQPMNVALWSTSSSWTETTITGLNNPDGITKLATAVIPTLDEIVVWTLDFSGDALANYLNNQYDNNQVASFLLTFDLPCPTCTIPTEAAFFYDKDNGNPLGPRLIPEAPTAVDVSTMSTEATPGRISLNWEVINDSGMTGFNVLRGTGPDAAAATLLNSTPILVQPGSSPGQMYYLVDGSVTPGVEYYYWLQVLYMNNDRLNGPVIATSMYGIYLPMVSQ